MTSPTHLLPQAEEIFTSAIHAGNEKGEPDLIRFASFVLPSCAGGCSVVDQASQTGPLPESFAAVPSRACAQAENSAIVIAIMKMSR
jgi:hypothetical protein